MLKTRRVRLTSGEHDTPKPCLEEIFYFHCKGAKTEKREEKITKIPTWILEIQQVWFCWWGEDFSETESQMFTVFVKKKNKGKHHSQSSEVAMRIMREMLYSSHFHV